MARREPNVHVIPRVLTIFIIMEMGQLIQTFPTIITGGKRGACGLRDKLELNRCF